MRTSDGPFFTTFSREKRTVRSWLWATPEDACTRWGVVKKSSYSAKCRINKKKGKPAYIRNERAAVVAAAAAAAAENNKDIWKTWRYLENSAAAYRLSDSIN